MQQADLRHSQNGAPPTTDLRRLARGPTAALPLLELLFGALQGVVMLKGIVTTLVLTLSTAAAFAAPSAPDYGNSNHALPDQARGHGWRRPPIMHWQTLASAKQLSGRKLIRVRSDAAFRTLKLEAASGTSFIDKVLITFGNGQTQLVDLDKRLSASDPLVIDLQGMTRKITKVEVYGRSGRRGSVNVLAV
jgi:hypothetical protein